MPDTQDKIGTLRETSKNTTKRGGREVPDEPQGGKLGTLHSENRQDKPRGGAEPGENLSHGYGEPIRGEQSVRRANDHVRKIADEY